MLIFGLLLIEVKVVFTTNGLYYLLSSISTSADQTGRIITFLKKAIEPRPHSPEPN